MAFVTRKRSENIEKVIAHVKKPSRYIGHEFNACCKNWDNVDLRIALVFPDLYEIGMSHHGLHILYAIINAQPDLLADRVYAPDKDLEELLHNRNGFIFGVESRRSVAEFDMIGITLPYELCYTNILTILALGGIPFRSADRNGTHPFVVGGGSGSFNPEPVADFFDAVHLGDGEEAVLEIAAALKTARAKKQGRQDTLEKLADIEGVYVPAFFAPRYDRQGKLLAVDPLKKGYGRIRRRILPDLESCQNLGKPLVPLVRIVHDRLGIEVARGCTRGCRFCQAGIIYRPVRERAADSVLELAEEGMQAGGFEELALLSLSTGDYSCLSPVLGRLMDRFVKEYVSVSMPSMRVGTLTPEIMNQIKRVRKTGFTLAPEAGTDRLRRVINKGITEDDLLATCRDAGAIGWKLLKFYFMIGLPTETEEDIKGIADLVHRAARIYPDRRLRINVSVAAFVPKAHTPFQWEPQISTDEAFARINMLKAILPKGSCKLKWHDPRQSFLEGVMSRGDRRLAKVIEEAWRRGARLDGWSEHYNLALWQDAAAACNMDLSRYLRRRDFSEVLPWQHLDTGVDPEFLRTELAKSLEGDYTPDCRVHGCRDCGVCDFKEIRPVVQDKRKSRDGTEEESIIPAGNNSAERNGDPGSGPAKTAAEDNPQYWYRLVYGKQGDIRFLSHLEVIQVFFQAFRRAGVKLHHTQGFNPVPKASFSPALPVGTESLAEYLDVDLMEEIMDVNTFRLRLNKQLPAGITILNVTGMPDKKGGSGEKIRTGYKIRLDRNLLPEERDSLKKFMDSDTLSIIRIRKGRQRSLDIRKQVESFVVSGADCFELVLFSRDGKAGAKPVEILKAVLNLSDDECLDADILKVWHSTAGEEQPGGTKKLDS